MLQRVTSALTSRDQAIPACLYFNVNFPIPNEIKLFSELAYNNCVSELPCGTFLEKKDSSNVAWSHGPKTKRKRYDRQREGDNLRNDGDPARTAAPDLPPAMFCKNYALQTCANICIYMCHATGGLHKYVYSLS